MTPAEKKKQYDKQFYKDNLQYYKDYRKENSEKNKKYLKEYFKNSENKLKKLERDRKRYQENREKDLIRRRNSILKYHFGITMEEYNRMLKEQNEVCAICYNKETDCEKRTGKPRSLAVDHCHQTGKIRGLLCRKCNTAIGLLKENLNIINNCINYLTKEK